MNLQEFAVNLLMNSPKVANNPQAQEMVNVIKTGDNVKGEQLARNLCQTYGIGIQDAYGQAQRFFHI